MKMECLILLLAWLPLRAATVEVRTSIAEALSQAEAGDTILVPGPAVYSEHLVVNKSVRLLGTNAPVIDAGGAGSSVIIQAPDVQLCGFIVRNSGNDLANYDSGVMITSPRATISHCQIDTDGFGVYLRGATNCSIEQNQVFGSAAQPSAKRGNGIQVWKTRSNRIAGNRIHDKRDGMYLSYADDNIILDNRVWDTRFGIHYMYSHQNRLLSNSLTRNAVGATLMFSRQSLVQGNAVIANRRHGMVFKQLDNSRIVGNVVSGQNRGFFVQQAVQNRFEGNIISTNDIGLYLSNCSEQNVFVRNAFIQNADQVWQPPFETDQGQAGPNIFYEKGCGNYWSDYTGSDRNQDGIGDTPYHETDVFGWIVDRHPEARVLALSPAVALLRKGEELLPLLDTKGVTDLFPLMRPPLMTGGSAGRPAAQGTLLTQAGALSNDAFRLRP